MRLICSLEPFTFLLSRPHRHHLRSFAADYGNRPVLPDPPQHKQHWFPTVVGISVAGPVFRKKGPKSWSAQQMWKWLTMAVDRTGHGWVVPLSDNRGGFWQNKKSPHAGISRHFLYSA
jgi:hypothetical protein